MENSAAKGEQLPRTGRRRSRRKSSKVVYERRRRWRRIGLWALAGVVGGLIVALIAVYAGGAAA